MVLPAPHEQRFLTMELAQAIARQQLTVVYQPQVCLGQGRTVGFEALLRWQHHQVGVVSPDIFIASAEQSGLIHALGDWVLTAALEQLHRWQHQYQRAFKMAVNVSAHQLLDIHFVPRLQYLLEKYHVSPHCLALELTESTPIEEVQIVYSTLTALQDLGVQLAIDDFGTGYASFLYAKLFQWDVLKLDRSFIRHLHINPVNAVITKNIINMSHELGFRVIAEGIEQPEELAMLQEYGCDQVQGYYLGRPLAALSLEMESQHFVSPRVPQQPVSAVA
jgi:EAL domain-containing protein (putative c-di-GMP-specific phosphodiesterase class I)